MILDPDRAALYFKDIDELLSNLKAAETELRARAHDPGAGFGSSSFDGRGGGPKIRVENGDGTYELVTATAVEKLALEGIEQPDPVKEALRTVHQSITEVRTALTTGCNAHARTVAKLAKQRVTPSEDLWCRSHLRAQMCEPRFRRDLCRFCYGWQSDNDELPPVEVFEIRARGKNITTQVLAELAAKKSRDVVH